MVHVRRPSGREGAGLEENVHLVGTFSRVYLALVRRMRDLPLRRNRSAFFALTWTAVHPIDASSPLVGATPESMARTETDIVVSLTGFDESLGQAVHSRHVYRPSQVVFGARFRDVLSELPDGTRSIDFRWFHEVEPLVRGDEPQRERA